MRAVRTAAEDQVRDGSLHMLGGDELSELDLPSAPDDLSKGLVAPAIESSCG